MARWKTITNSVPPKDKTLLICMEANPEKGQQEQQMVLVKYIESEGARAAWEDETGDKWHVEESDRWQEIIPPGERAKRSVKKTRKFFYIQKILANSPSVLNGLEGEIQEAAKLYYLEGKDTEEVTKIVWKEDKSRPVYKILGDIDRKLYPLVLAELAALATPASEPVGEE